MNKQTTIEYDISIDQTHIQDFPLTTSAGTKRMKQKFHMNAVEERNQYIFKEKEKFLTYQKQIYQEMNSRVDKLFPEDKTAVYENDREKFHRLEKLLKLNHPNMDDAYKLDFYSLIDSINEENEVSLQEINSILLEFISRCEKAHISLTLHDFCYTMFTQKYMGSFLENMNQEHFADTMKKTFESIYWECPDVVIHLKLNLLTILMKYQKQLSLFIAEQVHELLQLEQVSVADVINQYVSRRKALEEEISGDDYYHLTTFLEKKKNILDYLEGAPARTSNFNRFTLNGDFSTLDEIDRKKYRNEILGLNDTLTVLKSYYRYEFIAKDMIALYQKKEENKTAYEVQLKEIKGEEVKREKLFKEYQKASSKGFLRRPSKEKMRISKLKMNEEILHLNQLYHQLHDLEITVKIQKQLSDTSSLDDLFLTSFSSYYYLEKKFLEHFQDQENFSLEKELEDYFQFIYSPDNIFLRKINAFHDYDISDVVSDKYRLSGLNISTNEVTSDNLDATRDVLSFMAFIYFVQTLSLEEMHFICQFRSFDPVVLNENKGIDIL